MVMYMVISRSANEQYLLWPCVYVHVGSEDPIRRRRPRAQARGRASSRSAPGRVNCARMTGTALQQHLGQHVSELGRRVTVQTVEGGVDMYGVFVL